MHVDAENSRRRRYDRLPIASRTAAGAAAGVALHARPVADHGEVRHPVPAPAAVKRAMHEYEACHDAADPNTSER